MKYNFKIMACAMLSLVVLVAMAGCSRKSATKPKGVTYHYIIHGTILALPTPGQGRQLQINAGPIRHWVRMSGKVGVMPAMAMPYQLATGVSTKGLKVGEHVVFHYEVNWQRDIAQITAIGPDAAKH